MINFVVVANAADFIVVSLGMVLIFKGISSKKFKKPLLIASGILVLKLFNALSNVLEWADVVKWLDQIEDNILVLQPLMWIFMLYAFYEQINQDEIRQNKDEFQVLVENQNDLLVKVGSDGILRYVNNNFCSTFGKTADELIGKPFLPIVHEEDRDKVKFAFMQLLNPPFSCTNEERDLTKDGYKWFSWSAKSVFDKEGRVSEAIGVGRNIDDKKKAEEKLQKAAHEKEILLKEVHHRVKNNMVVLYGLIQLQQNTLAGNKGASAALEETKNRIRAIGRVHQMLYHSESLAEINFAHYISQICSELESSYNIGKKDIKKSFAVEHILLNVEKAIPIGLILNELVSNVYKHAFAGRKSGNLSISFKRKESGVELFIKDDGIGLDEEWDKKELKTLGLKLVKMLTRQLNGQLSHTKNNGSIFNILFPDI